MYLAEVAGNHPHGSDREEVGFCSYCGRLGGDDQQRVCSKCGLGVRLRTDWEALRSPGAIFLIVRVDGTISAASATAEREFGPVVDRPLLSVVESSDLPAAAAEAAGGNGGVVTLPVTRADGRRFRGGLRATVAPCGDPPAALVVVERV
jgi:ribosomal protein L37E